MRNNVGGPFFFLLSWMKSIFEKKLVYLWRIIDVIVSNFLFMKAIAILLYMFYIGDLTDFGQRSLNCTEAVDIVT